MTLDEALKVVKQRYGLRDAYVSKESGKMIYVLSAERELRAIPEVKLPGEGIGLLAYEVVDLAEGTKTIEALVRKKNPDLFVVQEVTDEINSTQEEIDPTERESLLNKFGAMSYAELQNAQSGLQSDLARNLRLAVIEKLKVKVALALYEDSLRDC